MKFGDSSARRKRRCGLQTARNVESRHVESVPVKEVHGGKTVWEGVVEIFELIGHPKASRAYAWAHDTNDPEYPRCHVTVLHVHPIASARDAVRAAIVQEFRSLEPSQEA
jgi:hypothetical protein